MIFLCICRCRMKETCTPAQPQTKTFAVTSECCLAADFFKKFTYPSLQSPFQTQTCLAAPGLWPTHGPAGPAVPAKLPLILLSLLKHAGLSEAQLTEGDFGSHFNWLSQRWGWRWVRGSAGRGGFMAASLFGSV